MDFGDGRPGLLYLRKREHAPRLSEGLAICAHLCLLAADMLQREQDIHGLRFALDETQVVLADRLRAPNTEEAFASCVGNSRFSATGCMGMPTLTQVSQDPRANLCVSVSASDAQSLAELLARTAMLPLR